MLGIDPNQLGLKPLTSPLERNAPTNPAGQLRHYLLRFLIQLLKGDQKIQHDMVHLHGMANVIWFLWISLQNLLMVAEINLMLCQYGTYGCVSNSPVVSRNQLDTARILVLLYQEGS